MVSIYDVVSFCVFAALCRTINHACIPLRYTKYLDIGLIVVLGVTREVLKVPSSLSQIIVKAGISAIFICVVGIHTIATSPFPPLDAWKGPGAAPRISVHHWSCRV